MLALLSSAVLTAGWMLGAGHHARFRGELRTIADRAALRVQAFVEARLDVTYGLRADWRAIGGVDHAAFKRRMRALQLRYPGYQALNWINRDHVIQWITPWVGNEGALGFDLDEHPFAAPLLQAAEQTEDLVLSAPMTLLQGGWGFVGYLRLGDRPHDEAGLLNVVFRAQPVLRAALAEGLPSDMSYTFSDGEVPLTRVGVPDEDVADAYAEVRRILIADRMWTLRMTPSAARVAEVIGPEEWLPVAVGLVMSVGIAALIAIGQWRQAMLRDSEQKYRNIVDAMNEGIWILDADGKTRFVNLPLARMLGYGSREMMGRRFDEFVDTSDPSGVTRQLRTTTPERRPMFELDLVRKDGSPVQTVVSVKPFIDDGGRFVGAQALVTDVTERKRLEAQLRHSQKMEAVGRLAGGIAHDFNNLTTGIMCACHLLEHELVSQPDLLPLVDDINKCGERAAGLTQQLLAFSRQQVLRPKVLGPGEALEEASRMLRRLIGEDVELNVDVDPDTPAVSIDPTQLHQVLINLVVNARDALTDSGVIWMRARNVSAQQAQAVGLSPTRYAALEVQDTGTGIPDELREQIFEPFFTTKAFGKGTGLGLSTVLGIVEQSGGHVAVNSRVGEGATFTVYLPAFAGAPPEAPAPRARGVTHAGGGTILFVEDEDAVRSVVQRGLEKAGYVVHTASRPREALAWAQEPQPAVDLLITDVVMPEMSGLVLADALRRQWPDLRVIYISGYADAERIPESLQQEAFVQKPFAVDALTEAARQQLSM